MKMWTAATLACGLGLMATGVQAADRARAFMLAYDKNGDGKVTEQEMYDSRSRAFNSFDTNDDGRLTQAEFNATRKEGMARLIERKGTDISFDRLDKNNDGDVTREEYLDFTRFFARADRNGDGALNKDEVGRLMRRGGGNAMM
ncbi:MAG: EF-hand domain-containing protein [Rhodobacterales bacterium]|nr:EF-hand domain-containing protein [Rhodobacterales bacterium]